MKIVREINGETCEFELTENELEEAYQQQRSIWDAEFVKVMIDGDHRYGERFDELELNYNQRQEVMENIANKMREVLDEDYDDSYIGAFDIAFEECIEELYQSDEYC